MLMVIAVLLFLGGFIFAIYIYVFSFDFVLLIYSPVTLLVSLPLHVNLLPGSGNLLILTCLSKNTGFIVYYFYTGI